MKETLAFCRIMENVIGGVIELNRVEHIKALNESLFLETIVGISPLYRHKRYRVE